MKIQDIEGRFGLVSVHPEDARLHSLLSAELDRQGRPAALLLNRLIEGGVRRGELSLADEITKQAIEQGTEVLVTPLLRDHPDHDAAAFMGRRAALVIANLGLLELLPYQRFTESTAAPSSPRSPDQPLVASDLMSTRTITHEPPLNSATYLWTSSVHGAFRVPILVERP